MNDAFWFFSTQIATTEMFVVLISASVVCTLWWKRWYQAFVISLTTIGMAASVVLLKMLFAVPRPVEALVELDSYAFPSGHATAVVFLAAVLWWYVIQAHRRYAPIWGVLLMLLIAAVGVSRIYLGVHTPLQVGMGYVLGLAWSVLLLWILYRYTKRKMP